MNLNSGANKVRLTAIGYSGANIDHLKWNEVATNTTSSVVFNEKNEMNDINDVKRTKLDVSISPNPVSGFAKSTINKSSELPVEVTVTDMSGNIHKRLSLKSNINGYYDLSVHDLPSGIYLVSVQQGKERSSTKLVVQNK